MSIKESPDTSCRISAIGNSGARSPGPTGWPVPGCSGGGGGTGRSGITLYHCRGISDSSSVILVRSVTTGPPSGVEDLVPNLTPDAERGNSRSVPRNRGHQQERVHQPPPVRLAGLDPQGGSQRSQRAGQADREVPMLQTQSLGHHLGGTPELGRPPEPDQRPGP